MNKLKIYVKKSTSLSYPKYLLAQNPLIQNQKLYKIDTSYSSNYFFSFYFLPNIVPTPLHHTSAWTNLWTHYSLIICFSIHLFFTKPNMLLKIMNSFLSISQIHFHQWLESNTYIFNYITLAVRPFIMIFSPSHKNFFHNSIHCLKPY